jgi:hypothetical protein
MPNQPRPGTRAHNIRITDELWEAAQKKAEERGETVSEAVRKFLERYVKTAAKPARKSVRVWWCPEHRPVRHSDGEVYCDKCKINYADPT